MSRVNKLVSIVGLIPLATSVLTSEHGTLFRQPATALG